MSTVLIVIIMVLSGTSGEIAITHAMKRIDEIRKFTPYAMLGVLCSVLQQIWLWIGLALMVMGFFAMLALLSWKNVSFVIPNIALKYPIGALGANFLLGEKVSGSRWMGILLICTGLAFVWAG